MKFNTPDPQSDNSLHRNDKSLPSSIYSKCFTYLISGENILFVILSIFQLSTSTHIGILPPEFSPTGPYGTAIPLLIYIFFKCAESTIHWIQIYYQDENYNEMIFNHYYHSIIKNKDIKRGHIIEI